MCTGPGEREERSDSVMSSKLEIKGVMLYVVSAFGCRLEREIFWSKLDEMVGSFSSGKSLVIGEEVTRRCWVDMVLRGGNAEGHL